MSNRNRSLWPIVPDRMEQKGFLVLSIFFFVWLGVSVVIPHGKGRVDSVSRCESMPRINEDPPGRIEEIPGIGMKRVRRIVAFRRESGPIQSFDELKAVSGIGSEIVEKIKRHARLRPCGSD